MDIESFPQNINYHIDVAEIPIINLKLETLYRERIDPYVPNISEDTKRKLFEIQKIIYIIDYYGEHEYVIDSIILDSMFQQLAESIQELGIDANEYNLLLQDLKDYANIETQRRYGVKLSSYDLFYFYEKKSCDVRLHRHIVKFLKGEPIKSESIEIIADVLDEIIDDIDDIEEDRHVPLNGNRVLEILDLGSISQLEEYKLAADMYSNIYPEKSTKIMTEIKRLVEKHDNADFNTE